MCTHKSFTGSSYPDLFFEIFYSGNTVLFISLLQRIAEERGRLVINENVRQVSMLKKYWRKDLRKLPEGFS